MSKFAIGESEYKNRIRQVREILVARDLDALYLTSGISFFYLTGYSYIPTERPAALVIPVEGDVTFMGPLLEIDHIPLKTKLVPQIKTYFDYPGEKHPIDIFAQFLKEMDLAKKRIGTDNITGAAGIWGYSGPPITKKLKDAKFVLAKDIIKEMRLTKSSKEIQLIRESAKWARLAHSLLQEYTAPGQWDLEVALTATREASMIMKKTLGLNYEPQRWGRNPAAAGFRGQIGKNSAIPHSISTKRPMSRGDVLITGAGADVGGYSCELERTMILGKPTSKQRRHFNVMLEAQRAAIEMVRLGVACSEVDKAATKVFKEAGFSDLMRHHVGHGLGLEGHEPPWLDIGNDSVLQLGMVVSCEPGIYDPGFAGFRHSDTILVTEAEPEVITYYPRDLDALSIER